VIDPLEDLERDQSVQAREAVRCPALPHLPSRDATNGVPLSQENRTCSASMALAPIHWRLGRQFALHPCVCRDPPTSRSCPIVRECLFETARIRLMSEMTTERDGPAPVSPDEELAAHC
jgi:hypothetical protein